MVGCPVAGFWQSEKKEIAIEGRERISDYRCFKSHHQLAELGDLPNDPETWLLYVLRDPRDIAISAASHFQFDRFPTIARLFRHFRPGEKLYRHTLYPLLVRQRYRLEEMTTALLRGSGRVHNWVRIPWREHWQPYQRAGIPIFRYEDLLARPLEECARVLNHLGLTRSRDEIARAVDRQSFAQKKLTLLQEGETGRAKFLRVGRSGQWREQLPPALQKRFADELRNELAFWNYPIDEAETV